MLKSSCVPKFFAAAAMILLALSAQSLRAETPEAALPAAPAAQQPQNDTSLQSRLQSHLALEAGGGFAFPSKAIDAWNTTGYTATGGVGYMLGSQFAAMLEYQYLYTGLTTYAKLDLSNGYCYPQGTQICANGHSQINGVSLSPTLFMMPPDSKYNGYFMLGAGVYRKSTSASVTDTSGNTTSQSYGVNKFGYSFGLGLSRATGWNPHVKYFADARFLWINTTRYYGNLNSVGRSIYAPVTIGLRY